MRRKQGIKKFLVYALTAVMTLSNTTPVFAYEYLHEVDYDANNSSIAEIHETVDISESGNSDVSVYAELGKEFTITVPKSLTLSGQTKSGTYTVSVEGDIAGTDKINVIPDETFTLNSSGLDSITASINQDKIKWSYNEITTNNAVIGNGTINASNLTAGKWSGTFNFNINLEEGASSGNTGNEEQSVLTLSVDDEILSKNGEISIGSNDSLQVNAYVEGQLANDLVNWQSDNENITVTDGLIETKASAHVGDTATITVTAQNPDTLSAMANTLNNLGIATVAMADDDISIDFTVTIVDIEYSVDEVNLKPGESIDVTAKIIPETITGTVTWSQTAISGINLIRNGNKVTIKVALDMETNKSYNLIATYGTYSKALKINIIEDHVCSYEETITKNATCMETGIKTFNCTCGDSYTEEIPVDTNAHDYNGEWKTVQEPSCTEKGLKVQYCSICTYALNEEEINETGHSFNEWTEIESPKCETTGSEQRKCDTCGYTETKDISAIGHSWEDDYTVDVPATCETDGSKSVHCTNCEATKYSTVVPATGHNYPSFWTTEKEATCTVDGSKQRICVTCGNIETEVIAKLGHDYAESFTIDKSATCTEVGTKSKHCSRCTSTTEVTVIPATGHTSINGGTLEVHIKCNVCGETLSSTHNYTKTVQIEPTCTEKGTSKYICTCGYSYTAQDIPATGHTEVIDVAKAATCTTTGLTEGKHCSVCNEILVKQNTTSATGHSLTSSITKDATCTAQGNKHFECSKCDYEYDEVITAKGHTYDSTKYITDEAATCTEAGSKSVHCDACNAKITGTETTIPALGHSYGTAAYTWTGYTSCKASRTCATCSNVQTETVNSTNVVTKAATCTATGTRTYTATFSNSAFAKQTKTETIAATGHTEVIDAAVEATCATTGLTEGKHCSVCNTILIAQEVVPLTTSHKNTQSTVTDPTCTTNGGYTVYCNDCKKTVGGGTIPATGHDFKTEYTIDIEATCTTVGSKSQHCLICDIKQNITEIPILEHTDKNNDNACDNCNTRLTPVTINSILASKVIPTEPYVLTENTVLHQLGYSFEMEQHLYTPQRSQAHYVVDSIKVFDTTGNEVTKIELPEIYEYNGTLYKITEITSGAFNNYQNLTSITIPSSVTTISNGSFYNCKNLNNITIAEDNPVYDSRNNCNAIIETNTNTLIKGCKGTTIPSNITTIGKNAFYNCTGLTNITIPNNITSIGNYAFYGCSDLINITIGSGITKIEDYTFRGCVNLNNITIAENNPVYDSRNNCNAIIETNTNTLVFGCKNTTIPSNITTIGKNAFYNCTGLTNITIPNNITSIGNYAFYECTGLTNITILDGVTNIGNNAFVGCEKLTNITIPNSVTNIGTYAFQYCTGLTNITLSNNLTNIGTSTFSNCTSLTDVTIPNGVTSIGTYAFQNCTKLAKITIPSSMANIDANAFYGCNNLTSATFEMKNGWYVGTSKGAKTTLISSSNLLSSSTAATYLKTTHKSKYWTCINASGIYDSSGTMLASWNESGIDIEKDYTYNTYKTETTSGYYVLTNKYPTATRIVLPSNITRIGNYAFANCSQITSINTTGVNASIQIPPNVKEIGSGAFSTCINLATISFPSTITKMGSSAFSGCTSLRSVTLPPLNMDTIETSAFRDCKALTSITIPSGVKTIKGYAFSGCTKLTNVTISSANTIGDSAFSNTAITEITIPDSVTSMGDSTFSSCTELTNVTLSNNLTKIGILTFDGCEKLTNITIGEKVNKIEVSAFYGCINLNNIIIPSSVTSIGLNAFGNCTSLTSITFNTTSGWYVGNTEGAKTTSISSSTLANKSTAATYLKSTYVNKYWTR